MQSFGGITFLLYQNETGSCVVSTHLVRLQFGGFVSEKKFRILTLTRFRQHLNIVIHIAMTPWD